jgi:hypothetical protein
MTDQILKLNSDNELIAEDPATGNSRPVPIDKLRVGGANTLSETFYESVTGLVAAGDFNISQAFELPDGGELRVTEASFVQIDSASGITAAPSGAEFAIADGSGIKQTILSGDGSSIFLNETGTPQPQTVYENTSGGSQQVFVGVDNGQFGSGSGADLRHQASHIVRKVI